MYITFFFCNTYILSAFALKLIQNNIYIYTEQYLFTIILLICVTNIKNNLITRQCILNSINTNSILEH